ncbi:MAG: TIGR00159 family protein, partial [Tidjanibacter sp.]|nr:TIGR00159 family protein [Tidjanibacter sp.]
MGFIEMGIIDIVDILLVALLLYYVYKFIKGSQATSIIVGLLMIYVLLIVVKALNMEMLSAILSSVTSVGLIAIFIIFQPEIRRFLKGFGEQSSNGNPLLRRL